MTRTGSDHTEGIRSMIKHAMASSEPKRNLLEYLTGAHNNVKLAFRKVLSENRGLLKMAADRYGAEPLTSALKLHKVAGMSQTGGALYVADKNTSPGEYAESFGSNAAEAFNGVLMRGYYYKDTRPNLNLAVQVQHYHDFHDARESGVYRIYDLEGKAKPALVVSNLIDLCGEGRIFFPKDDRTQPVSGRAPSSDGQREPNQISSWELDNPESEYDRSHKQERIAVFGDGSYVLCNKIMGEQVTEVFLKGTKLYRKAMKDATAAPAAGKGIFVFKRGAHYLATKPIELKKTRN